MSYIMTMGIVRAERQEKSHFVHDIPAEELFQASAVAEEPEVCPPEFQQSCPIVVDKAKQMISALLIRRNSARELHCARICSQDQHLAEVSPARSKTC